MCPSRQAKEVDTLAAVAAVVVACSDACSLEVAVNGVAAVVGSLIRWLGGSHDAVAASVRVGVAEM